MSNHPTLHAGESLSYWIDSISLPNVESLKSSVRADVCIVGAGIGGLTTAYLLQKEGKKVCVLEDHEIGSGQTGRTTAHFTTALDDRYFNLETYHGLEGSKLAAQSHQAAIDQVIKIVREENIECDLEQVSGYLFCPPGESPKILRRELDALHRAGLKETHFVERAPLKDFDTGQAIEFPFQVQLHPLKYLKALALCILKNGGEIYTHSHVSEVHGGKQAYVKTKDGFEVKCDSIVVATNTPINDQFAIHTKQAPYRTYVLGARIEKGSIPKGLYWDTLDPYHYVRIQADEMDARSDLLIVGGEDHKTGQDQHPTEKYGLLEAWMRSRFPAAKEVTYRWSGQVMEPVDGLAYLGHNPLDKNNVYIITGDSGNGMTHCTIGGMLITDQIMGRENAWESLYSPSRKSLRSIKEFLKENINVAVQYSDWLKEDELESLAQIQVGEGAVFRSGAKIIAAYREAKGKVKFMSAACPHLGGVVRWNTAEKSWDCPCHGSRFDATGKVIEGPSMSDLKKLEGNPNRNKGDEISVEEENAEIKIEKLAAMDLHWTRNPG